MRGIDQKRFPDTDSGPDFSQEKTNFRLQSRTKIEIKQRLYFRLSSLWHY